MLIVTAKEKHGRRADASCLGMTARRHLLYWIFIFQQVFNVVVFLLLCHSDEGGICLTHEAFIKKYVTFSINRIALKIHKVKYYVYILTNFTKTVLYTGVTNNLEQRIVEHYLSRGNSKTFTGKYHVFLPAILRKL